jgi:hypothetical protein
MLVLALLLAYLAGALAATVTAWLWWMPERLEQRAVELAEESRDVFLNGLEQLAWMREHGVGQ